MVIELLMRQMSSEAPIGDEVFFEPELVVRVVDRRPPRR